MPGSAVPVPMERAPVLGLVAGLIELPRGSVALLHGPKGVGKSTLVQTMLTRPWMCCDEMAPQLVLEYARRQGTPLAGISMPSWIPDPTNEILLGIPDSDEPWDVILDSATATGHPVEALRAVRKYCQRKGVRGVVIVQQTKDGQARGSATLGFDVDVELELENNEGERRICVVKSRFGAEGSRGYTLGADGISAPKLDGFYSVEGDPGRYRLVRHPAAQRLRHAGYLWALEEQLAHLEDDAESESPLDIPKMPVAVAALRSRLYGGWVEPMDSEARRAHAHQAGLNYYSPIEGGKLWRQPPT